jgi:hypothetical protein
VKWLAVSFVLLGCGPTEEGPLLRRARLVGEVSAPRAGGAWLLLYRGKDRAQAPSVPVTATAISAARFASGDTTYVFAALEPNPYRLRALVDVDRDFDPSVDVLAQPTRGDFLSAPAELELQPGLTARQDLEAKNVVQMEPPAAEVTGRPTTVAIDLRVTLEPQIELMASDVGGRYQNDGFRFRLVDDDGNGLPDDADGDGQPDLSLTFVLRWLPRAGQLQTGVSVVLPLVVDPRTILAPLAGRLDTEVVVSRLPLFVVPQALRLEPEKPIMTAGTAPAGAYELVVLSALGQFWRLPNALGAEGQRTRFEIVP